MQNPLVSKRLSNKAILLVLALSLYLGAELIELTSFFVMQNSNMLSLLTKGCRYCSYFLCIVILLYAKVRLDWLKGMLFMGIIVLMSCLSSGRRTMVFGFLFIFAAEEIEERIILKTMLFFQGLILIITILLSQVGIWTDYIFISEERARHGLGFSWTTTGPILYFYFLLGICYLYKEKIKLGHILIMELINLYLFKMTDTKMAFVLSSLFLVAFFILSLCHGKGKVLNRLRTLFVIMPAVCCLFSYALVILYNPKNEIWLQLDKLLSGRLKLGQSALQTYGVSVFGKPVEWVGWSITNPTWSANSVYNYVDCSYIQMAINYGWVFLLIAIAIYTGLIYRKCQGKCYYEVLVLVTIVVFAVTEPRLMDFSFNIFPVLFFCNSNVSTRQSLHSERLLNPE